LRLPAIPCKLLVSNPQLIQPKLEPIGRDQKREHGEGGFNPRMSATPKPVEATWVAPQAPVSAPVPSSPTADGQDALQVLLAFACIHEQAIQRRCRTGLGVPAESPFDEYFGLDEVLRLVAARALAITGADGVAIALARDNAIVCRAAMGKIAPDTGIRLDPDSGFSGACLRNGQSVRCNDSDSDPRVNPQACRALGARSMVAVPLMAKGRVVGLIEAFSSEAYGFNASDVSSLELLGELILAAIHPEEEDKLAQLAEKILPQPPAIELAKPPASDSADSLAKDALRPAEADISGIQSIAKLAAAAPKAMPESLPASSAAEQEAEEDGLGSAELVPGVLALQQQIKDEKFEPNFRAIATGTQQQTAITLPETSPILNHAPAVTFPEEKHTRAKWLMMAALLLVAVGLGWTWVRHAEQLTNASTTHSAPFTGPGFGQATDSRPQASAQAAPKPGTTPAVTGIRHWSSPVSSTVVVDLEDQVQYEAHTLEDPPRIYFDLFDTKLAPGLLNQSILVDDTFIKRVRMAQPKDGTTRVVLDTKGLTEVSVKLDPNPYRLTIDVHKPPVSSSPVSSSPLTKPSPAIEPEPKKASRAAAKSSEFRIVLDAGHGGWDLGTVGRKGLLEKDLVLDIVQRLGRLVQQKLGADVVYTRTDDSYLPLEKRAEIANLTKSDLFLSVHANYSDLATARGVETYYTTTYSSMKARTSEDDPELKNVDWTGVNIREKVTNSHRLAADVQESLFTALAARNPGIRNRGVKEAQYVVLTGTQMPAILAEVSFVSSPKDEDYLENSTYRQQIAEALYRGIEKYRAETRHTNLASRAKRAPTSD
jgi:N-acetylmuramoyl-L-alanine amidase/GAF domain-containing protein